MCFQLFLFSDSLVPKWNTAGGNRTRRSVTAAPWLWRHQITLAMRHQHQLLLPCLLTRLSGGRLQLFGYTKCVPLLQAKQECTVKVMCHVRQAADRGHACILVATIISCGDLWLMSFFLIRPMLTTAANTGLTACLMPKTAISSLLLLKTVWLLWEEFFQRRVILLLSQYGVAVR